jgi:hypothetical protein
MYASRITLQNLRTIASATVALRAPPLPSEHAEGPANGARRNLTVLLGNNGAGKTTVLRAVAMAAMAPVLAAGSGFVPYSLVRRTGGTAAPHALAQGEFVLYEKQDRRAGTLTQSLRLLPGSLYNDRIDVSASAGFDKAWEETLFDDRSMAGLVVGYGADRRVESVGGSDPESRFKRRSLRYGRIAGLFEESVALVPLSSWLPRFHRENAGRHKQVITLINKVLPDAQIEPAPRDGEYYFSVRGSSLPFAALSDGYRAFIGWFADLLFHICLGAPSGHRLDETTGIALIDEVDLHLHPAWQLEVVPRVADALPYMQFVVSTHSPLVVGSLHRDNVLLLTDHAVSALVRETRIAPPAAETFGLGAEQLLTSESFGLVSTRTPDFVDRLQQASRAAQQGSAEATMHFLRLLSLGDAAGEAPPAADERPAPAKKPAKKAPKRRATKKASR